MTLIRCDKQKVPNLHFTPHSAAHLRLDPNHYQPGSCHQELLSLDTATMPPPRQADRKKAPSKPKAQRTRQTAKQPERKANDASNEDTNPSPIDLSISIPLSLQQLLLDVFKTALLPPSTQPSTTTPTRIQEGTDHPDIHTGPLDTKSLVQTIKSHLYQRDFDSAFMDAGEDLLRVYALRWSAARALGYAGIFKAVLGWMRTVAVEGAASCRGTSSGPDTRAVCIGGGAGAEIVALAAAWRDLEGGIEALGDGVKGVSLGEGDGGDIQAGTESGTGEGSLESTVMATSWPRLHVAAVDIADWSSVVERLARTMVSADVPGSKTSKYQPPLVPRTSGGSCGNVSVSFHRSDVLSTPESELKDILLDNDNGSTPSSSLPSSPKPSPALLITLMFTLNELFSTSMAKATALLLRLTDTLPPGAALLVVDSPGSYSTLKLGKGKDGAAQERKYPMKFLLDHTLLSVADGKWERVLTEDSRWWRRDAARLRYEVGEGAGLEDMRFQVHLYRRLS